MTYLAFWPIPQNHKKSNKIRISLLTPTCWKHTWFPLTFVSSLLSLFPICNLFLFVQICFRFPTRNVPSESFIAFAKFNPQQMPPRLKNTFTHRIPIMETILIATAITTILATKMDITYHHPPAQPGQSVVIVHVRNSIYSIRASHAFPTFFGTLLGGKFSKRQTSRFGIRIAYIDPDDFSLNSNCLISSFFGIINMCILNLVLPRYLESARFVGRQSANLSPSSVTHNKWQMDVLHTRCGPTSLVLPLCLFVRRRHGLGGGARCSFEIRWIRNVCKMNDS